MATTASKPVKNRSAQTATGRIEARVLPEQKTLFERAAALRGVNLKTFMVDSMQDAALKTLKDHDLIRLTAEERRIFVETLLSPPGRNQALRSATKRYNRLVAG
ncbi:MAG TPA: DUF1778 domain-containing protein [Candidatus Limnocylindrales bacterium]|jgi:uncharacterized protein (DUF1778 family)|nr:DUF1778 domain-containing protein [Candidatus Limnocylindrales bacterium]